MEREESKNCAQNWHASCDERRACGILISAETLAPRYGIKYLVEANFKLANYIATYSAPARRILQLLTCATMTSFVNSDHF